MPISSSLTRQRDAPEPGRVRVLDAPHVPADDNPRPPSAVGLLVGFAAAMVLGLWLTAADAPVTSTSNDARQLAAAAREQPEVVPDLVGMTIDEATTLLGTQRLSGSDIDWTVRWRAGPHPAGVVVDQSPPPGSTIEHTRVVEVVTSEGGPVVTFADLPDQVRSFARTLTGFDDEAPLLAAQTPAGIAYKNDDWLFGECPAVTLARSSVADERFAADCFVPETMTVSGVLPDGTSYRVWGLPVMSYPAPAPRGSFVFESERGVRALGATTYTFTGDDAAPTVSFAAGVLSFAAGPWRGDMVVHAGILGELGDDVMSLTDAVHPSLVDGALVVVLDDPLRWPEPGELFDGVQSHHGRFVVVDGCPQHRHDVVCDPTGAIGVIGIAHPVRTSELAIRLGAEDEGRLMVDSKTGMEWRVPVGWQAAADRLTSVIVPREVFTVSTQPLEPGGASCPRMLTELGPHDVLVTVFIGGTDTLVPWPRPIAASDLGPSAALWGEPCAARPELDVLAGAFTLDTVPLRVLVAFGEAAPSRIRAEAWRLLDSISVNPEM